MNLYNNNFRETIEKASKEKSLFAESLELIQENVEIAINEWMPGYFSVSLEVNRISGFQTTAMNNSNVVVVMASERGHQSNGGTLSVENPQRGEVEKDGFKESNIPRIVK
ncbi:MAG: hypothetical protein MK188_11535 [Gammaproteobacteria bacterium]|nr:hypothetical protein [Gammaproteobacteria bacterium]